MGDSFSWAGRLAVYGLIATAKAGSRTVPYHSWPERTVVETVAYGCRRWCMWSGEQREVRQKKLQIGGASSSVLSCTTITEKQFVGNEIIVLRLPSTMLLQNVKKKIAQVK